MSDTTSDPQDNNSLLSARSATVIDPDGGVHKRGNWDDVVQNTHSTAVVEDKLRKKVEKPNKAAPSDIWEEQGGKKRKSDKDSPQSASKSDEPEGQDIDDHPKIVKHKLADEEEPVPETSPPDTIVEDTLPASDVLDNEPPIVPAGPDQLIADDKDPENEHELELQETLSSRLVRYGKTAVTSLVLPLVTPKVTAGMLTGKHEGPALKATSQQPKTAAATATKRSIRFVSPAATNQQAVALPPKNEHLLETVSRKLGISKNEALTRLHGAVNKANQDAAARASAPGAKYNGRPHPVARVIKHNPPTNADNEIGVYVDIEGGKALSFNPTDVLRVLGQYLS